MELSKERKWCVFDVEGDAGEKGILGTAIFSDQVQEYQTSATTAIDILRTHARTGYTLVAHNAEYDITVFFWQLKEHVETIYLNKRFNRGEWRYDANNKPCQIWDSLGISGGLSLKQVGIAIGLPKYDTPQKLLGIDPDKYNWQCEKHQTWECEECYAVRDAQIVYEFMLSYQKMLNTYDVKPKRTIGSAAVALWRSICQPSPIHLRKREIMEFSRQAYYGGRVECFKLGKIRGLYTADVKSMYPSCMVDFPFPDPATTYEMGTRNLDESILQYEGATEATVYIPDMYVPPLPVVDSEVNRKLWNMYPMGDERDSELTSSKLLFPVGTVRGVWTNCELRAALVRGCKILELHRTMYSQNVVYEFGEYVGNLRVLREDYIKNKDPRQLTAKILMNSLYGRIGLNQQQIEDRSFVLPIGKSSRDYPGYDIDNVGGEVICTKITTRSTPSPYANVLWAAYITARARIKLLEYMELQHVNLAYCDTDSIFSVQPINGLSTGFGSLEDTGFWDTAYIGAPKVYHLSNTSGRTKSKAKGLPYKSWPSYVTQEEWERIKSTGHGKPEALLFMSGQEMVYNTVIKPKQGIHRHKVPGTWVQQTKQRRHTLQKRRALDPEAVITMERYSDTQPLSFGISSGADIEDSS